MIAKVVWLRYRCLCQIFFSLLEIMVLSVKIRPRNTRIFLCPGKCGCWIRVRLPFSSGFDSKTNFSYTWDLQAQSLCISSEKSPYRRKRGKETVRTLVILQCSHLKNMEEGIFKDSVGSKALYDAKGRETLAASNGKGVCVCVWRRVLRVVVFPLSYRTKVYSTVYIYTRNTKHFLTNTDPQKIPPRAFHHYKKIRISVRPTISWKLFTYLVTPIFFFTS